ncbi:MAG: alanine racemase [Ignavibacteria bacterium]|nr:MAG: alanine racemase [Ignavibacteria bacterium]
MRKTFAKINLDNLKFNYLQLRKKVGEKKICAVVKADAYGHGMLKCVEKLESLGEKKPDYYGVAMLGEAVELRKSKLTKAKIISFSHFDPEELEDYYKYKVIPSVTAPSQISTLNRLELKKKLLIHVNIDTGMRRTGLEWKDAVKQIIKLSKIKNVVIDGIYTHFATSDEKDKSYSELQLSRFTSVLAELDSNGINYGTVHAANSGAILDLPESYFDMVRPGISLYGYYPSLETSESVSLKPVLELESEIYEIKNIQKGESVSYGRIYKAPYDMKIASVAIGYADGYNRNLSNRAIGIIKNQLAYQIGRVTMDRIMFDVNDIKAKVGDKIILLGKSKHFKFDAWDWAKILNTIPYEITCAIGKRVPRIYKG